jgi:formylglycine-generating enzyme required for sulfatase activity
VVFNPSIPMKVVKPGQYTRVTSTRQQVTLTRGFWMGSHEVTQREFESAMGGTPSFFKGETLPVDKVSFLQAAAFCKAITIRDRKAGRITENMIYRLPTEEEWEYARSTSRFMMEPGMAINYVGFRVVLAETGNVN